MIKLNVLSLFLVAANHARETEVLVDIRILGHNC